MEQNKNDKVLLDKEDVVYQIFEIYCKKRLEDLNK